ncbi:response regulator [Oxalobacter paraformigenes]|uniref:histidine kinase n=1 Tax=Oxalobacter paraformigenes TaxID=556268 RepID=C3X3X9_9BURK|nr:response regulator [Oxalobacter paraformigenes]EEO27915.2 hypothetical protein OFAG_01068 [Oxalobacter paraformigenes]
MVNQAKNLETILNNLNGTALYVIRQSDRRILYFNDLVRKAIPHIRHGDICQDAWQRNCARCPLQHIGKTGTYETDRYAPVFGEPTLDVTAISMQWEEEDAYLISLAPHKPSEAERRLELERRKLETVTAKLYPRAISVNLSRNTYSILHNALDNLNNPPATGKFDDLFQTASDTLHPDFREEFGNRFSRKALLPAHAQGTREIVMEHRQKRHDNQYRWTDTHFIFLDNPVNDDVIAILLSRNIDDDKQAALRQEELNRARQTILHEALKNTSMYEFYYYPRKNLAILPRRMYEHYGYRERYPDVPYDFAREMVFGEDHENYFQAYRKIREGEKTATTTYRLKDGQTWREVIFTTISEDDDGRPTFVVGLSGDITEHKKAELENIKLQSIYDFTIQRNYDCILIWNVETGTYEARFSDRFDARGMPPFGRNTSGVRKFAALFVCEEDRRPFLDEMLNASLPEKLDREKDIHLYFRSPQNGELRHKELSLCYIGNKRQRILMTLRDIHDMLKKEEQHRQALTEAFEAAKSANEAKSHFLSRMSHDMRTPMNAIIGLTTIAKNHPGDTGKIRDCLEKIDTSSQHLLNLINEVLDTCRIESGKFFLEEKPFTLSGLIGDTLAMTRPAIQRQKHTLRVNVRQLEHETIKGDPQRIQEIFLNILSNAIKYTPDGGVITWTISESEAAIRGVGCYRFVFEDNGIGMSDEFRKKIFEPFEREKDSRTNHIQGTGLGMTIALTIARLMNGSIDVESEAGKGSRFTVTLYLKWLEDASDHGHAFAPLRVLVVAGETGLRDSLCRLLYELGSRHDSASSGKEALRKIRQSHEKRQDWDAVLLDNALPDMSGSEAASAIHAIRKNGKPALVLMDDDWPGAATDANDAEITAVMPKPVFKTTLTDTLKRLRHPLKNAGTLAPPAARPQFAGKRILLAEDNPLNAEIACELIAMSGVIVETAGDGKAAVDKFAASPAGFYHLVFMDIQMPVMNGHEATGAIRELPRPDARTVPIIAMTANTFPEDIRKAFLAGMNGHIPKPLDIDRLNGLLQKWLGDTAFHPKNGQPLQTA